MKVKKIFTRQVAYQLIEKGFDLIDMEDNLKHKNLKVFIFEETNSLMQELTKITESNK